MEFSTTERFQIIYLQIKPFVFPVLVSFGLGVVSGVFILPIFEERMGILDTVTSESIDLTESDSQDNEKIAEDLVVNSVCDIRVDVAGAVNAPGVYCLQKDSYMAVAIEKAGGINRDVFAFKYVSQKINQSSKLIDQQKIYVPFEDDVNCTLKQEGQDYSILSMNQAVEDKTIQNEKDVSQVNSTCISLNNASIEELDTLPGVGISTAQKIIAGRTYKTIEDLNNVSGIGDTTFAKLKPYICL